MILLDEVINEKLVYQYLISGLYLCEIFLLISNLTVDIDLVEQEQIMMLYRNFI